MLDDIKLLDRVIGDKKEMYLAILKYLAMGLTEEQVGTMFNRGKSRISQIFKANRRLCDELTMSAELATKAGRLRKAFKVLHKKGEVSKKDTLEWLEYCRKEIEGEKSLVDLSTHITKVTYEWRDPQSSEDTLRSPRLSEGKSLPPCQV